jgi:hypothetical protein
MLCFAPAEREVAIAPNAPAGDWELKLLPIDQMNAVAAPKPQPGTAAPASVAAPTNATASNSKPEKQAAQRPGSRNNKAQVAAPPANGQAGFQRTDVNASKDAAKLENEDAGAPVSELNQSSFVVAGSVNNGAASPFAQSQAFGNMRKGPGPRYNGAIGGAVDNSALNARSFSLTGQPTPKPAYNHLQGTVSFGGPIYIPRLLPLTRTSPNFFFAYQWMRNRNASTQTTRVPTDAERNGDLSKTLDPFGVPVKVIDPENGSAFAGNVIPLNRLSTQAKLLLPLYPLPNFTDPRYNYQIPIVDRQSSDGVQSRINKAFGPKNQANGSFNWQRSQGENSNVFAFRDANHMTGINVFGNWSHRWSQRIFTNTRLDFSRAATRITPYFAGIRNVSGEAGIKDNNQEPLNWGPPRLSFSSGIASLSDAQQSFRRDQTSGISSSTTWNRRAHNLTFGGDLRRQQFNLLSQQDPRGTFTFTGAAAGSDFAGFLLGIPDTVSIAYGNDDKYFRATMYDAYFTDDWRVRPGFTLNAGARWEYNTPITELYGRLVNLDIAPGFTAVDPVVANAPNGKLTGQKYPDSLVHPDKSAFEPRVAIAWHPILGSSMVVRGGYGVYYNTSVYTAIALQMAQQSPLSTSFSVSNKDRSRTLAKGFQTPDIIPNTFAIDPYFRVGYAQNWQVSVQRDLPAALIVTGTYLGIKGTHAQQQSLPNTFPADADNPCPACPSGFSYVSSNGNSTRNAGTIQVRRRLHNGFGATLQYTFAKALDDASLGGKGQLGTLIAQNWLDLRAERARSNFDQRHLLSVQMQYSTGMGIRGGTLLGGWRGRLFKNWTFVSQMTAGSGLPLTPVYPAAVKGTGFTGSIRPDYTGAPLYDGPPGLHLNPAAFTSPAAGQWGNAGRNSITGPPTFTLNASLARSFVEGRFDFRLDSTNALNHPVFPAWNTNISSAQFGLPVPANAMRVVQANLRMRFF